MSAILACSSSILYKTSICSKLVLHAQQNGMSCPKPNPPFLTEKYEKSRSTDHGHKGQLLSPSYSSIFQCTSNSECNPRFQNVPEVISHSSIADLADPDGNSFLNNWLIIIFIYLIWFDLIFLILPCFFLVENNEMARFAEGAKNGNLIPLYKCIFSDHLTPVLAYRCLVREDDREAPSFLFESVEQGSSGTNVVSAIRISFICLLFKLCFINV